MMKERIFEFIKEHMASAHSEKFVPGKSKVSVGYPCYGYEEIVSAVDSLLDLRLSQGRKVEQFEHDYARYVGTKHGVAVNSGSSANLLAIGALMKAGRVKQGDEVIVPAATFTTVVSPILQHGLVPVFVDVDPRTFNISPEAIGKAITPKTGLIMPVHSLGCPADMPAIMAVAERHGLPVIEDCCEAHSATIDGKMVGSFGLIGTYSFFVAHNMTTGEGGMVMTSDDELDYLLRSMREFGRLKDYPRDKPRFSYSDETMRDYDERYVFELMGYNVRMTDITASLGIEQLKRLPSLNERRLSNVAYYDKRLKRHARFLTTPFVPEGYFHSFYGYTLLIHENAPFARTQIVRFLEAQGIETRAFMGGNLAVQPAYRGERIRVPFPMPVTEMVMERTFFIGSHPQIGEEARKHVCDTFDRFFSGRKDA